MGIAKPSSNFACTTEHCHPKTHILSFNLTKIDFLNQLVVSAIHADPSHTRDFLLETVPDPMTQPAFKFASSARMSNQLREKKNSFHYHEVFTKNAHHSM